MACRPPYQPQFPQTTWGRLVTLQRGQVLLAPVSRVQLDARLLRDLDLEVFFLGTAISSLAELQILGVIT